MQDSVDLDNYEEFRRPGELCRILVDLQNYARFRRPGKWRTMQDSLDHAGFSRSGEPGRIY